MTFEEIRTLPTSTEEIEGINCKVHESVFRSYHILNKVVYLLQKNTPKDVIIELINDMNKGGLPYSKDSL